MYLKIVVDNQSHYLKCGAEVSVVPGDARDPQHPRHEDRHSVFPIMHNLLRGEPVSLFPDLQVDEMGIAVPRTIVTDGDVYLLDDSGKTVDIIKR